MPDLHILVGIPACGKSTWARQYNVPGIQIISSDAIREELTGDVKNQHANDSVFDLLHTRTRRALGNSFDVIVDATNLKPTSRAPLLEIAKSRLLDAYVHRFVCSDSFELCQMRNLARERKVPEDIMRRFHGDFLTHCRSTQLTAEGWIVIEEL